MGFGITSRRREAHHGEVRSFHRFSLGLVSVASIGGFLLGSWPRPSRLSALPLLRTHADRACGHGLRTSHWGRDQSAFAFSRIAACSFLMSSGDNCGRSTLIVNLLSLAVSGNGGL
jgi:hypothetical protein